MTRVPLQSAGAPEAMTSVDWPNKDPPDMDALDSPRFELGLTVDDQMCVGESNDDLDPLQITNLPSGTLSCMLPLCSFKLEVDDSERLRQHYGQDHPEFQTCQSDGCIFVTESVADLESHHHSFSFSCPAENCARTASTLSSILSHFLSKHVGERTSNRECHECGEIANTQYQLEYHASETGHAAFACSFEDCSSTFSRADVLERHKITHSSTATRYPCKYCKKYRGQHGFKRKDHLTQHIRNYHHIGESKEFKTYATLLSSCSHNNCEAYQPGAFGENGTRRSGWEYPLKNWAFKRASDYTAHMRKVHNESPFPCPEARCPRRGAKGYFRKRDLLKHQKREHAVEEEGNEEQ